MLKSQSENQDKEPEINTSKTGNQAQKQSVKGFSNPPDAAYCNSIQQNRLVIHKFPQPRRREALD